MAQTLTLTQLQAAQKLIANGDLNGFYQYMHSMGYNYAGLAGDVVTDEYPTGTTADDYLIDYAKSQGVAVTPALLLTIETQLATAYITVLEAAAKASPSQSVSSDITFGQALNFHTQVFQNNGLNAAAWTLDVPYQVLGQSAMDAYWSTLTGTEIGAAAIANGSLSMQMVEAAFGGNAQAKEWLLENAANGSVDGAMLSIDKISPFASILLNAVSPNPLISLHTSQFFNLTELLDEAISTNSSGSAGVSGQSGANNSYTVTLDPPDVSFSITYAENGAISNESWTNPIGLQGSLSYAADGSSTGTVTYADGNYATTLDDGQGNITTDYYTKDGIEIRSTWVHSDGSSGTVNLFADGTTLTPGGGTYDVPSSESIILQNPDGSYSTVDWNANDASTTTNFAANGGQTSQSTGAGTGVDDLTVASSNTAYVAGEEVTSNYNASGALVGDSWYAANPDGSVNPNGVYLGWAQATATSGTTVDNASGVIVQMATALDGSLYRDTQEPRGDTVSHLTANGTLLADNWTIIDGSNTTPSVTGSDTFNADGSGSGTFSDLRDNTAGTVTLTSQGDITVVNTNATSTVTSEDIWNGSNGTYEIAMLSSTGTTLGVYDYLANGSVTDSQEAISGWSLSWTSRPGGAVSRITSSVR
ncbi:MAG: autotransporter outer membrane beta-barrel domain-containing protein [Acidobacteriaceae bacterium]